MVRFEQKVQDRGERTTTESYSPGTIWFLSEGITAELHDIERFVSIGENGEMMTLIDMKPLGDFRDKYRLERSQMHMGERIIFMCPDDSIKYYDLTPGRQKIGITCNFETGEEEFFDRLTYELRNKLKILAVKYSSVIKINERLKRENKLIIEKYLNPQDMANVIGDKVSERLFDMLRKEKDDR